MIRFQYNFDTPPNLHYIEESSSTPMEIDLNEMELTINRLADELLLYIFSYLPKNKSILPFRFVSRRWRNLLTDNETLSSPLMSALISILHQRHAIFHSMQSNPNNYFYGLFPPLHSIPLLWKEDEDGLKGLIAEVNEKNEVPSTLQLCEKSMGLCKRYKSSILRGLNNIYVFYRAYQDPNQCFSGFFLCQKDLQETTFSVTSYAVLSKDFSNYSNGTWIQGRVNSFQTSDTNSWNAITRNNWNALIQGKFRYSTYTYSATIAFYKLWETRDEEEKWIDLPLEIQNRIQFFNLVRISKVDEEKVLGLNSKKEKIYCIRKLLMLSKKLRTSTLILSDRIVYFFINSNRDRLLHPTPPILLNDTNILEKHNQDVGCIVVSLEKNWACRSYALKTNSSPFQLRTILKSSFKTDNIHEWSKNFIKQFASLLDTPLKREFGRETPLKKRRIDTDTSAESIEIPPSELKSHFYEAKNIVDVEETDLDFMSGSFQTKELREFIQKRQSNLFRTKDKFIVIYDHSIGFYPAYEGLHYPELGVLIFECEEGNWRCHCLQDSPRGKAHFNSFSGNSNTIDRWDDARVLWMKSLITGNKCEPFALSSTIQPLNDKNPPPPCTEFFNLANFDN